MFIHYDFQKINANFLYFPNIYTWENSEELYGKIFVLLATFKRNLQAWNLATGFNHNLWKEVGKVDLI